MSFAYSYFQIAPVCIFNSFPYKGIDLHEFLLHNNVECIVSPANSYGLMDGGFDLAISEEFGWELQERVQKYIVEHYKGEQPIGSSFIIDIGTNNMKLIHTPTMRIRSLSKIP